MEQILYKKAKGRARELAIEQGAYDGRFRSRVDKNRKKDEFLKLRKEKFKLKWL